MNRGWAMMSGGPTETPGSSDPGGNKGGGGGGSGAPPPGAQSQKCPKTVTLEQMLAAFRQLAADWGGMLLKHYKQQLDTQASGRSGGHGKPYDRAAADLERAANILPSDHPLAQAMKAEAKRLRNRGKGHSHK